MFYIVIECIEPKMKNSSHILLIIIWMGNPDNTPKLRYHLRFSLVPQYEVFIIDTHNTNYAIQLIILPNNSFNSRIRGVRKTLLPR